MKLQYIKDFTDIFTIKLGKSIKDTHTKECYRVPKIISSFFHIYYYGGAIALVIIFIFLLLPNIFDSILITFIITLLIYMLFEVLVLLVLPLKKIKC